MKLLSLIQAVVKLLLLLAEAVERKQVKRDELEYQSSVEEIRKDPIAYANRKFGGVRSDDDETEPSSVSRSRSGH